MRSRGTWLRTLDLLVRSKRAESTWVLLSMSTNTTTSTRPVSYLVVLTILQPHPYISLPVQPVVQRETVDPTVVHKTEAIHEKVEDAPIVHEVTTLPTISADKYAKNKSSIEGEGDHCSTCKLYILRLKLRNALTAPNSRGCPSGCWPVFRRIC